MKFILILELGNEAMSTRTHISEALKTAASQINAYPYRDIVPDEKSIRDHNGNRCGSIRFEE